MDTTRKTLLGKVALAAAFLLSSPWCYAQGLTEQQVATEFQKGLKATRGYVPTFDSQPVGEDSGVSIEAGAENQVATFRLTFGPRDDRFSVTLSSPIGEDEDEADLIGFNGLSDSLSVEISYTWFAWPRLWSPSGGDSGELHRLAMRLCREVLAKDPAVPQNKVPSAKELASFLAIPLPEFEALATTAKKPYLVAQEMEKHCTDNFDDIMEAAWTTRKNRQLLEWRRATVDSKKIWMFGVESGMGRDEFSFADPDTFADRSETEVDTSFGVSLGLLFPGVVNPDAALWFTARKERVHTASTTRLQNCDPIGPVEGNNESCGADKVLGPPSEEDDAVIGLQYRRFFGLTKKGPKFGIAPRVFVRDRETKQDIRGVDLPFFFLADEDGKLTGGLRATYRSTDDDFSVSIFVGTALQLFEP